MPVKKPVTKTVAKPATKPKPPRKTAAAKPDVPRPEIHAKQITLIISVGTEDRERDWETFLADVKKAVETSKTANVKRVVSAGGHYILDGKVCLPQDYDPETQNFKPGATPPPWAGGPAPSRVVEKPVHQTLPPSRISKEEAERRIAIGKAKYAKKSEIDEFEDFTEWEAEDANDSGKLESVADESIAKAVSTVKKTAAPKKRIVKKTTESASKPAPAKKPVSRRRRTV